MRRRGCLISFGALAGLSLLCCVLLWFVGLPRLQDSIADGISNGLSTEVAEQFDTGASQLEPGTHTITMTDLESQLQQNSETQNVDDITFTADNGQLALTFGSQDQTFSYTATPVAENGRLELTNVESDNGFLDQMFPADKLAGAIEGGVNDYFEARGLQIVSVDAENGQLTFETERGGA
jgi:hypothetical protein